MSIGIIGAIDGRQMVEGLHTLMLASFASHDGTQRRLNARIQNDVLTYEVHGTGIQSRVFAALTDAIKHYNNVAISQSSP